MIVKNLNAVLFMPGINFINEIALEYFLYVHVYWYNILRYITSLLLRNIIFIISSERKFENIIKEYVFAYSREYINLACKLMF